MTWTVSYTFIPWRPHFLRRLHTQQSQPCLCTIVKNVKVQLILYVSALTFLRAALLHLHMVWLPPWPTASLMQSALNFSHRNSKSIQTHVTHYAGLRLKADMQMWKQFLLFIRSIILFSLSGEDEEENSDQVNLIPVNQHFFYYQPWKESGWLSWKEGEWGNELRTQSYWGRHYIYSTDVCLVFTGWWW